MPRRVRRRPALATVGDCVVFLIVADTDGPYARQLRRSPLQALHSTDDIEGRCPFLAGALLGRWQFSAGVLASETRKQDVLFRFAAGVAGARLRGFISYVCEGFCEFLDVPQVADTRDVIGIKAMVMGSSVLYGADVDGRETISLGEMIGRWATQVGQPHLVLRLAVL